MMYPAAAFEGAHNLLLNCAGIQSGDRLLILYEDPGLGWYDKGVADLAAHAARDLSARVELQQIGGPDNRFVDGDAGERSLFDAEYDCCIFFARVGDQLRFDSSSVGRKRVMCYATTVESLASAYGRIEYQITLDLKNAIDSVLLSAEAISIQCPLGTSLSARLPDERTVTPEDVTVRRFPLGVHAPVEAAQFSGSVQLARYLTPTGSRVYQPPWVSIRRPVTAGIRQGQIVTLDGDADDVDVVSQHYRKVAGQFSLEADGVLSWHCGIHPGCYFDGLAADDPDRWSNSVFTHPRFLHFHTCGSGAPGEICWMVLDPTVRVDGVALWESGALQLEHFAQTRACLDRHPQLAQFFAEVPTSIGISA